MYILSQSFPLKVRNFYLFIMQLILLLVCILVALTTIHATEFNTFKSYKDAGVKPPQYGKARKVPPSIAEYLSPEQMEMVKFRSRKSPSGHTFNENWSGFREKPSRRLDVDPAAVGRTNNLRG